MEKYVECNVDVQDTKDWTLTVDAKMLFDLIKSIDASTVKIHADADKDILTITTEKDNFSIKWISSSEYVALPEMQASETITIPAKDFATWMSKVEYAVIEKMFSPVFTWVFVRTKQEEDWNKLVFVWTDSFILNEYKIPFAGTSTKDIWIIIPKQASSDFHHLAKLAVGQDKDATITMEISSNLVACSYTINDIKVFSTSILIQGNFPDYENEKIMPKKYNTKILLQSSMLDKEIKKISILTRDMKNFVALKSEWDILHVSSWETEKWDGDVTLPMQKEWEDFEVYINGKYLSDYIRAMTWSEIEIRIIDKVAPLVILDHEDTHHTCILRPVQL